MVEPNEYVSGSTIVACWLVEFVNGSVAMIVTATFAEAVRARLSAAMAARASASGIRLLRGERANFMEPPLFDDPGGLPQFARMSSASRTFGQEDASVRMGA